MNSDNIFLNIKSAMKKNLLNDLKNDFKDLSEQQLLFFINNRLNENKNWDLELKFINIEDVVNQIFPENDKKINEWKKYTIDNFNKKLFNNYYIYLKYILNIFKNKTDIILDRMNFTISSEQFEQVYSKVFMPHYNEENKDRMKQKKFRLKQKLCKGCINKEHLDYEIILFQFILNNPI